MKTKIFCDSADFRIIKKLNKNSIVDGFTTNPSLMKSAGAKNYKRYALKLLKICKKRPISLEVFGDTHNEMLRQALIINSWGKNVFVKIPIVNSKGIFSGKVIKDMGAGLNIYNVEMLKDRFYLSFPNGLTFNYYLLFYTVAIKRRFRFFPLNWGEDDQVSNLNLFNHLKEWLEVLFKFIFQRGKFLKGTEKNRDYKFEVYSDT